MTSLSIITVCLNSAGTIERTIKSVIGQSYPGLEYIIVDGGSTDGTLGIIDGFYRAGHVNKYISEKDRGISDAFNKGIALSSGEIIGIINAGDRYVSGAASTAVRILETYDEYGFVHGDVLYTDLSGNPQYVMKADSRYMDKLKFTLPPLNHPTVFMRRSVYESCGLFDVTYNIAMDYEFFLRIASAGTRGYCIDHVLAEMEVGGISNRLFFQGYKEVCRASIQYGYSPVKAYARLYLKGMRGAVRIVLEKLGLDFVIRALRKAFWNITDA